MTLFLFRRPLSCSTQVRGSESPLEIIKSSIVLVYRVESSTNGYKELYLDLVSVEINY